MRSTFRSVVGDLVTISEKIGGTHMGDTRKLSVAVVLGFVAAASTWSYAGTLPNYSFTIESPNPFQVLGSPVPLFNTQSAT